ncbi:DNA mismatch repair protein MutL [Chitinispirillum alkaliphilum]|nr:DNA mismatch repair protein MutL [Chitinispirillum alkaliphilum]
METNNTKIKLLPTHVIEKIAAGEVVERPASVLKELIENSIDSGATRVDIVVDDAGFSQMKITDNGSGMSGNNLSRCLQRHATSKISSADDLFSIATMGFRGEALASIAAVSRLTIVSSDQTDGIGYTITSTGGEHGDVQPSQHLRGTTIIVRDLFFNVPARMKFMKSHRAEKLALVRMIEQMVIPFPGIHFSVTIDGKKTFELPVVQTPLDRIASVTGTEFARGLVECSGENDGASVCLYVSSPEHLQSRPRFQSLYVNLRRIDNDSVTYAIREAFSSYLGHGNKPSFFCFLDIDPQHIDVNVHPTKQQVKFENDRKVAGFVYRAAKKGIETSHVTSQDFTAPKDESEDYLGEDLKGEKTIKNSFSDSENPQKDQESDQSGGWESSQTIISFPSGEKMDEKQVESPKENSIQFRDEKEEMWNLIPCYQIHGVFILAQIKKGILLIDQHAAHERVLFEQALNDLQAGRSPSQQLLFPVLLEVSPTEKAVVESGMKYFEGFGFEMSDFGGNTVSVSAIPAFLKDGLIEETVRNMIRYLLDGKNPESFDQPARRFAAAFACGAAIKAGQKLSQEEMNALLNSLFSTENPYTCPHGRPTLVRISLEELTRRFLR